MRLLKELRVTAVYVCCCIQLEDPAKNMGAKWLAAMIYKNIRVMLTLSLL